MNKNSKIYLAGHDGLVGSAVLRKLKEEGYTNLAYRTFDKLDLRRQRDVEKFFNIEKPEYVILAAAKVGGILANNTYKAEFIYDNIMIAANVINTSYKYGVKKLLNLGSSCIYPKFAEQPMKEDCLLTGALEPTNEPYAIAKITAIKLSRYYNEQYGTDFISVMPTNLYGPHDNFDLKTSHVLPALLRKFHEAKIDNLPSVTIWGSGTPYREFLYVEDMVSACLFIMKNFGHDDIGEIINIGTGKDITIKDLAHKIKEIVGYDGEISFDKSKPDGPPKKLLNVDKLNDLGWKHKISLEEGIKRTYHWYLGGN